MKINLDNIGKFISHVTGPRNKLNPEGFELRIKTGEIISAKKDLEGLLIQAENQKEKYFHSDISVILQKIKGFLGK